MLFGFSVSKYCCIRDPKRTLVWHINLMRLFTLMHFGACKLDDVHLVPNIMLGPHIRLVP